MNIQIDTSKIINILTQINQILYKPTHNPYGEIIDKKLTKIFGKKINQFKNMIEKSNSIISGSYVLQTILDEDWNSDIDIFCFKNDFEDFAKKNNINFYKTESTNNTYYCDTNIINNIKYKINNTVFDIVVLNCDDIKNYIKNFFDFDVLKNYCYVKNNKFVVDVLYPKQIHEKTFEFNHTHNFEKSFDRMEKYIKRGFTVIAYRKNNNENQQIKKCNYDWNEFFEEDSDNDSVDNSVL